MKRTRHPKEFKMQVVNEAIDTGNAALVARRYELSPNMVNRWVKEFKENLIPLVNQPNLPHLRRRSYLKKMIN